MIPIQSNYMKIQVCELFLKNEKEKKIRWKIRHEQFDTKQIERKKIFSFVVCPDDNQSTTKSFYMIFIHVIQTTKSTFTFVLLILVWLLLLFGEVSYYIAIVRVLVRLQLVISYGMTRPRADLDIEIAICWDICCPNKVF